MVAVSMLVLIAFVGAPSLWHAVWSSHVATTTRTVGVLGQVLLAGHTATSAWVVVMTKGGQVQEIRTPVHADLTSRWALVERWATSGSDVRLLTWSRRIAIVSEARPDDLVFIDSTT